MDDQSNIKQENDIRFLQNTARWVAIAIAVALGIAYTIGIIQGFQYDAQFIEVMYQHLIVVVGIPGSVIVAFVLVTVLEQVSGPIKFKGLGFEFEGASGPIIMWVIVFTALVSGIRILW